jgi:hypothetical protein
MEMKKNNKTLQHLVKRQSAYQYSRLPICCAVVSYWVLVKTAKYFCLPKASGVLQIPPKSEHGCFVELDVNLRKLTFFLADAGTNKQERFFPRQVLTPLDWDTIKYTGWIPTLPINVRIR